MLDANQIEQWANLGVIGIDTQVFDLTDCEQFVQEMASAQGEAGAPMFFAGLPPAARCLFWIGRYSILASVEDGRVVCRMVIEDEAQRMFDVVERNEAEIRRLLEKDAHLIPALKEKHPELDFELKSKRPDYLAAIVTPNEPAPKGEAEVIALWASAACEFIAMPIAQTNQVALPRPFRRRMERSGVSVSLVAVRIRRGQSYGKSGDTEAATRALHFVSGHWRRADGSPRRRLVSGEWRIWIEGHWRGNPDVGIRLHRYIARPSDRVVA